MKCWRCGVTYVLLIVLLAACTLFLGGCGEDDQLKPFTVKRYNESGELVYSSKMDAYDFEIESYDNDGKLEYKSEMKRDSDGRLLERRYYDADGECTGFEIFEYKGPTATSTGYTAYGEETGYFGKWVFDNKNRPIEVVGFGPDSKETYGKAIKRDSHGNIIEVTSYQYDSGENWIDEVEKRDISYKGGHAVSSEIERTIYDKKGTVVDTYKEHLEYIY